MSKFEVEIEYTTNKTYTVEAKDSTTAEDVAIALWKLEFPTINPAVAEVIGMVEAEDTVPF